MVNKTLDMFSRHKMQSSQTATDGDNFERRLSLLSVAVSRDFQ